MKKRFTLIELLVEPYIMVKQDCFRLNLADHHKNFSYNSFIFMCLWLYVVNGKRVINIFLRVDATFLLSGKITL